MSWCGLLHPEVANRWDGFFVRRLAPNRLLNEQWRIPVKGWFPALQVGQRANSFSPYEMLRYACDFDGFFVYFFMDLTFWVKHAFHILIAVISFCLHCVTSENMQTKRRNPILFTLWCGLFLRTGGWVRPWMLFLHSVLARNEDYCALGMETLGDRNLTIHLNNSVILQVCY